MDGNIAIIERKQKHWAHQEVELRELHALVTGVTVTSYSYSTGYSYSSIVSHSSFL
jgi:hypothetical protein